MTGDTQELDAMNAEQAADFAALQAAAADAPALPGEPDQEAPPSVDLGRDIAGAVSAVVFLLTPAYPSLARIYTPEAVQAAATAAAAVCKKHGWLEGGIGGKYAEEIGLALAVVPLALATYEGVKTDIAARKKPEPERIAPTVQAGAVPQAEAPPNPAAKAVIFGAPAPLEAVAA